MILFERTPKQKHELTFVKKRKKLNLSNYMSTNQVPSCLNNVAFKPVYND